MDYQKLAIKKAVHMGGGPTRIACRLGVTPPTVHQWLTGKRPIPIIRCVDIEALTGVDAAKLRPDVDWKKLRGKK
jgi:DNA-binding transcriptional regulator YdaS (Cro superfamily)